MGNRALMRNILGVCALIGGLTLYLSHTDAPKPVADDEVAQRQAAQRQMMDAMVKQIVADSRAKGVRSMPRVIPAPRQPEPVQTAPRPTPPVAPQGFSLVSADGEMAKGRMSPSERSSRPRVQSDANDWLRSPNNAADLIASAQLAGRDWTFGWVEHDPNTSLENIREALARHGASVLGTAGNLIRAKLPASAAALSAISDIPGVSGLGAVPKDRKLPDSLAEKALLAPFSEQAPVFITLMAEDPDGRWRVELEALGAAVADYDPDIRAYAAVVAYGALDDLAAADFVLSVEPIGIVEATHESAVPAMGADALRTYRPATRLFSGIGGATVPIAVMDTGLNINHLDIASRRSSVCGVNFVSFFEKRREDLDLWVDENGHGTHVTGTVAGNGAVEPALAGMAPSVRHIRFAKVLARIGSGFGTDIHRGMDWLASASSCPEAGWSDDAVKPLVVNMSLAASSREFEGRGASARKLDATVWQGRQLYVVANANSGRGGFSNYGTAKNSLAVGAAMDTGELAGFSSHGPTADGRLSPLVVGTGVNLRSAKGDGSRSNYISLSGTSMSSPAVAGVATLLMDAARAYRERPALARARLMASAIKPDAWLDHPAGFPLNNSAGPGSIQARYGLGKVSARTSVLNRNRPGGWVNRGSITTLKDGEYAYRDITVPPGASRLDLVMTWDEPPTDAIASSVLNDLDLWLDEGADCETVACGEHASTSRIDNVEWIIVRNPKPGVYRAKVAANRVYTQAPRAALAWTVIRGTSTPTVKVTANRKTLKGSGTVKLSITADAYVAAGSRLHIDCRSAGDPLACDQVTFDRPRARVHREDRLTRSLEQDGLKFNLSIALGEVAVGETQTIELPVKHSGSDAVRLHFIADAWNGRPSSVFVTLVPESASENGASSQEEFDEVAAPTNDHFAQATSIADATGTAKADLLLATSEAGEPKFGGWIDERPFGSIWFKWQAPATAPFRFSLIEDSADRPSSIGDVSFDVFTGSQLVGLKRIASAPWGGVIFAEQDTTYHLRVSNWGLTVPLTLQWTKGPRPENDDFAASIPLRGADGTQAGSNLGSTLESGESFGDLAATSWYRWRAPSDGDFRFRESTNRLKVLGFTGNRLSELRLVSGLPQSSVLFPAKRGQLYRIAVAAQDAFSSGRAFELSWEAEERASSHDDFESAQDIGGEASSSRHVQLDSQSTVQPGEPLETGIRTTWYKWTAPTDGRYTWRLGETKYPELQLAMFSGTALNDLELVGRTGASLTANEFALDVAAGELYHFALGFAANDSVSYSRWWASATLQWGPTPSNDDLAGAAALSGTNGTVSGSNEFATAERGERGGKMGHSSLWWTFQPAETGWYRFSVAEDGFALAVYRKTGSSGAALELVRSGVSHQADATDVLFYAEAGQRYAIRLGRQGNGPGGQFTLNWSTDEAPVWLRYAGNLVNGGADAAGETVEIENSNLALDAEGARLYAGSSLGLQVFKRDAATGLLTFRQLLEGVDLSAAALLWDPTRSRLYSKSCSEWRSFTWNGESGAAEAEHVFTVEEDDDCADKLLLDSTGANLYSVDKWHGLGVFSISAPDEFQRVQFVDLPDLKDAALSNDGSVVYAASSSNLNVLERDANTCTLARADGYEQSLSWADAPLLAVAENDRHLFVIDDRGTRTALFDLSEDPANPRLVNHLPRFWESSWPWKDPECQSAATRSSVTAVDVLCHGSAFAVQAQDNELEGTDYISPIQADRYNNPIRDFGNVKSTAYSPDGKHIYVSTERQDIVILERVGASDATGEAVSSESNTTSTTSPQECVPADRPPGGANRPPVIVNPIPDQTVDVGQSLKIDLSTFFTDPDGDAITSFGFTLSNRNVDGGVRDSGMLTLVGQSPGNTTVGANARDSKGRWSEEHFFVITVRDDT